MVSLRATLLPLLAAALSASALFTPPKGAITVSKHGKADYASLGAALNDTSSNVYFVYAGNYTEGVYISRSNVTIYGQTLLPHTYLGNTATISRNMPASIAGSNDLSGTVRVKGTNVAIYNVSPTFLAYGKLGSQTLRHS
jgi:pectinesterase